MCMCICVSRYWAGYSAIAVLRPAEESAGVGDGETLSLGKLSIQLLHTPGHTEGSICVLVGSKSGPPEAVVSGDTMFVGSVGRTSLPAVLKLMCGSTRQIPDSMGAMSIRAR